jgi:hypothetical protein
MPAGGDLLTPPETYRIPADPVGKRPLGESPRTTPILLWITLLDTWYHLGAICVITLFAGVLLGGASLLVCCPIGHILNLKGQPDWVGSLTAPLYWPLGIPIGIGYTYVLLLVVQHARPKAREVLGAFKNRTLYFNVLLAAALPALGSLALWLVVKLIAGALPEMHPTEDPVTNRFLAALPYTFISLLFLPFAFSGLDAIVARAPWAAAIRRSLGFAVRNPRLFAGFAVIFFLVDLAIAAATAAPALHKQQIQSRPEDLTALLSMAVPLGLMGILLILLGLVGVQFYREFVWREREAAAPTPTA